MIHEAEVLKKLMKKTQSKGLGDEAEIDSLTPLYAHMKISCPCDSPTRMTFTPRSQVCFMQT
jgi:hypothetical protein